MNVLSLIIKREFIAKVRNKSFIVMTFLSPFIFVGLAALVGYLSSMKADVKKIAIHDETGLFVDQFENSESYEFQNLSAIDVNVIKDSILSKAYEGLIVIPKKDNLNELQNAVTYVSDDSPSMGLVTKIESTIEDKITNINLLSEGIDLALIEKSKAEVSLNLTKASGEATVKGLNEIKIVIGGAFGYLIFMFIIVYGNLVMRSVIEEKTNRIIEIIISSVKPFQLMMGKIIGTSLAGILQFVIWGVLGGLLMMITTFVLGLESGSTMPTEAMSSGAIPLDTDIVATIQNYIGEILKMPLITMFVSFIVFFIGGYFLYSSLYAAIGAAVDNETDSQQFLFPIMLPLMLAVYVGFFTVINDPHGTVATVFSMIPFTSPIVMLMRIPFGVPVWQIIVSVCLLFATFILFVWLASKIYRVGVLMYGTKPSWKELYKWLKY